MKMGKIILTLTKENFISMQVKMFKNIQQARERIIYKQDIMQTGNFTTLDIDKVIKNVIERKTYLIHTLIGTDFKTLDLLFTEVSGLDPLWFSVET